MHSWGYVFLAADERRCLTEKILGAAFEVSNTLGAGFREKVYERALLSELRLRGLRAEAQVPVSISYKGTSAGHYLADIVVEDEVVLELKCVEAFALSINFHHAKVQWKRFTCVHQRSSAASS